MMKIGMMNDECGMMNKVGNQASSRKLFIIHHSAFIIIEEIACRG